LGEVYFDPAVQRGKAYGVIRFAITPYRVGFTALAALDENINTGKILAWFIEACTYLIPFNGYCSQGVNVYKSNTPFVRQKNNAEIVAIFVVPHK
jgi:hypothetical protein